MTNLTLTGRADLHIHTAASDGIAPVDVVLEHIAARGGLDVVAITDHDCLDASLWAYQHRTRYPFDIVPGMEVSSADGHVLALWVTHNIPAGMSLEDTAAAIHEQGGVAVMAHPFEPTIMGRRLWRYFRQPEVLIKSGMDAVETHNAGAFTPGCNWVAKRMFAAAGLPVIGSSDAHMPGSVGTGITRFRGKTAADLRASLSLGLTAAEGTRWSISVYLKLLHARIHRTQGESLETSLPSTRPI